MIPICNCGKNRRAVQAMSTEQAAAVVAQQVNVQALDHSTIVDPAELVEQPRA